jgi:hypothetical protein
MDTEGTNARLVEPSRSVTFSFDLTLWNYQSESYPEKTII